MLRQFLPPYIRDPANSSSFVTQCTAAQGTCGREINILARNVYMYWPIFLKFFPSRLKAKFHYVIQLATSMWPARERVHVVCVTACRRPNSITLAARDQIASRSATSSRSARRSASEQDSVMEYGLNRSATRFELSRHVEIAHVGNQVCDLDSVMEFSLKQVANQLAS